MGKIKYIVWSVIQVVSALWFFLVVAAGIKYMFERDGDVYGMLSILAVIVFAYVFLPKSKDR